MRAGRTGPALAALALALLAGAAEAARYALLVGVSGYPNVPGAELRGPPNDVPLLRGVLLQRGFQPQDVRVLADKVKGAHGLPTRAAILAELDALAKKAGKGDYVFLAFGGHGSRQPAKNLGPANPEPDGLDEIFLPIDVGKWSGGIEAVQNAIVDDEFGARIAAIRNRGAFVWVVFDACHSGTITRGISDPSVRYRDVTTDALGIPAAALDAARAKAAQLFPKTRGAPAAAAPMTALQSAALKPDAGGFVAFYAAQSWERTPEAMMPPGGADPREFGVFSYTLAEVLAMNPAMTYRQAAEQILHRYRASLGTQPTPLFEGSALDAPVFDTKVAPQVLQWAVDRDEKRLRVPAGSLHRIGKGAIFSVVANPADRDTAVIGYLRATGVQLLQSDVVPVAHNGKPALRADKLPEQAYARLVNPATILAVRVALPPAAKAASPAEAQARQAIERLSKRAIEGLAATWVGPGQRGDVRLAIEGGHLWFLPPTAEVVKEGQHKSISIDLAGKSPDAVAQLVTETLRSVARVANLLKLAALTSSTAVAQGVELSASYERQGKTHPLDRARVPALRKGDNVMLAVRNRLDLPADVNLLFVDSRYGIDHVAVERIEAGGQRTFRIGTVETEPTAGRESLVAIVTEAEEGNAMADFRFLKQPTLPKTRGAGPTALVNLFEAAGFAPHRLRGGDAPARTLGNTALRLFSWDAVKD